MATVKTVIEKAYTKVNGEYEAMTEGSDDWKTYLNVLNQVMEIWARTPYVLWQSLFNYAYTLPDPIAAGTFVYDLADGDEIKIGNTPYDHVFIMDAGLVVKTYKITDQALFQSAKSGDICAYLGGQLHFKDISDDIIGLEIRLPAYVMPPLYTLGSQRVNIDSVAWLTTYMAAFICDSSPVPFIARNSKPFYEQAKLLMIDMKTGNRHRQHLVIKSTSSGDGKPSSLSAAIDAGVGIGGVNAVDGGTF